MKQSGLFSLKTRDFLRSLAMVVLGAVSTAVYDALQGPQGFNFTWAEILGCVKIGAIAGLAYLIKNFFTKPDVKVGN